MLEGSRRLGPGDAPPRGMIALLIRLQANPAVSMLSIALALGTTPKAALYRRLRAWGLPARRLVTYDATDPARVAAGLSDLESLRRLVHAWTAGEPGEPVIEGPALPDAPRGDRAGRVARRRVARRKVSAGQVRDGIVAVAAELLMGIEARAARIAAEGGDATPEVRLLGGLARAVEIAERRASAREPGMHGDDDGGALDLDQAREELARAFDRLGPEPEGEPRP